MTPRRWAHALVALALLAGGSQAFAQGSLQCSVAPPAAVLGHPVQWTLTARDTAPLPTLTATQLAPDWLLTDQQGASGSDAAGHREQSAVLTLYPLRSGALALPTVQAGSVHCATQLVTVAAAAPGEAALQWRTRMVPAQPYALQPLRIELWAIGGGNVVWSAPQPHSAQAQLTALADTSRTETIDGVPQQVQVFAWQALPLQAGPVQVDFGLLRAHAFGSLRVYAPPPLQFAARVLPQWWPANGLIGRPTVQSLQAATTLRLGETGVWRLRLASPGLDRAQVLRLVNAWSAALPAVFGVADVQVRRAEADATGEATPLPTDAWDIAFYLRPQAAGRLQPPALRLDFFDPTAEVPAAASWTPPPLNVDDPRPRHLTFALAGAAVSLALLFGLRAALCALCRQRRHARLLHAVRQAGDSAALRRAWLALPPRRGAAPAATLAAWIAAADLAPQHPLRDLAARLQQQLYAPAAPIDVAALAAAVHQALVRGPAAGGKSWHRRDGFAP